MTRPTDLYWMQKAYEAALGAELEGEVPVGAVLVDETGQLLSVAHNRVIQNHDPTAHAEINVLREAGLLRSNYRLNHTTLYVTLEPCPMCASALVHARIKRLVFALRDFKTGACGTCFNFINHDTLNHQVQVEAGVMEEPCLQLIQKFFKQKR